ncbi:MAG: MATE family efflux transporter [Clostridia bacterium]|nr:MATE family efflux transporter [Clostridia bacterium]
MKASSARIDLTRGPIIRRALLFALPICIGNVLQQLYGTVDTLVVGNYCGPESLAAVGTSSQPIEMFLCLFMGLGTGVSILVSQHTGSGDSAHQRAVIANANVFLYLCAIPLTILGFLFGPLLLRLMQVPEESWSYAVDYIRILFLGTLGNLGYNVNAGILRGVGDSRSTLLFLLISCVTNIVLDLLFVVSFGMDVAGVALATSIAMILSWVCSMVYIMRRYPELGYTPLPRGLDKAILKEIIRISLPLGLNQSIYSVGHFVVQALINGQGFVFAAACSVGGKVNGMANVAIQSMASAATAFAGQNLGAKRYDRLYRGGWRIPFFTGALTCAAGLVVTIFCAPILRLFNDDPEVLVMAERFVRTVLPFCWTYAVFNSIIAFVNGMGLMKYATIVNILVLWVVRIPVAFLIATFWDGSWVMVCYSASFVVGMLAMLLFFLSKRWKEIRVLARGMETA